MFCFSYFISLNSIIVQTINLLHFIERNGYGIITERSLAKCMGEITHFMQRTNRIQPVSKGKER